MVSSPGSGGHTQTERTNYGNTSQPDDKTSAASTTLSTESPTAQYFRQPRYSSIRVHPKRLEASFQTGTPSHESLASTVSAFTRASTDIARPTPTTSNHQASPSQTGSSEDDWNDTRSVPLGPRWQDYTYREGDNFYGRTPRIATKPSVISKPALSGKQKSAAAFHGTAQHTSGAVSALKSGIVSKSLTQPVQPQITEFEVARPARVRRSEDRNRLTE